MFKIINEIRITRNLSMKNNNYEKKQPFAAHNTIRESLNTLNNIISDKVRYLKKNKDKKIIKDYQKKQENFPQYLRHHEKMPRILTQTFKIVQVFQKAQRRVKGYGFFCLQNSLKIKQNKGKKLNNFQMRVYILKENIQNVLNKSEYRHLNQSFQAIKDAKNKKEELTFQKTQCQLENIRILGSKSLYTDKQLSSQHDRQENSIQNNILDESVYQKNWREQKILQNEEQNLLIKLNELQCQILRKQIEIKKNKQQILRQIENTISGSNRLIETQENVTINDSSYLKYHQLIKQDSSFSHILGAQNRSPKQTLNELLEKNRLLQEQADHIRVTNEELLKMGRNMPNLNPQILAIFEQVNIILAPSPLGLSKINN